MYFARNGTGYLISVAAVSRAYDRMYDNYFEPMLWSFKFKERKKGILIQNLTVTPTKVKTGEPYIVKFEALNEEGIEKKKVIYGHTKIHKSGRIFEARSRTFTFAPYETKTIEWTLHANIPGGRKLYSSSRTNSFCGGSIKLYYRGN